MSERLELIINQIDATTRDGRIMKENLKRIEKFINDFSRDTDASITTINNTVGLTTLSGFNKLDTFLASDLQTVFNLSATPAEPVAIKMFVNHIGLTYNVHFTVSGTTVTFIPAAAGYTLEASNEFGQPDRVDIYYVV